MKKKTREQEETNNNNNDKQAENKENTFNPDNYGKEPDSGKEQTSESGTQVTADNATDKKNGEVKTAEEKVAEIQDKYIRLSAEFDNYRKRTLREKMDLSKYAGENVLLGIIPLMDDFERARAHMDSSAECSALRDGIELIYGKFGDFLKQNGVKEIESLNSTFNVDLHEAVAKVPVTDDDKKGKVIEVVQKGYYLQDKVLRFSKVIVGE